MSIDYCTAVPNPGRTSGKLAAKFCALGQIGVYQVDQFCNTEDCPSKHVPCRGFVHRLRQNSILFEDDVVRKLVNESCSVFLELQRMMESEEGDEGVVPPNFLNICRQYRCVVRACVMELQEVIDDVNTDATCKEMSSQNRTIYYGIELIYHLCEILCLDVTPGSILLPRLLEWLCFHFPIRQQAQQVLDAHAENPDIPIECDAMFWPSVKGLILRSRCKEARELLGLHSKIKKSPAIVALRQLLLNIPSVEEQGGTSVMLQFTLRWNAWQKEVLSHIECGTFSNNPHLQQIAEVLAAQEKGLAMIHEHSDTWYQFLVSYVTYWQPAVQGFQLGEVAQKCKRWFGSNEDKALDNILMALFESDPLQVLKLLQQYSESGWAAVHLTDMLCHAGNLAHLDSHDHNVAESLREDLLLQYGCMLCSHPSLWTLGIHYLDHCPKQGRAHLELIFPTLMYGTETRILRVMWMAERRNFKHVVNEMCVVHGRTALKNKRLGTALTWALRAQDVALCSSVADAILRAYSLDGNFQITDLLDSLGTSMLISDRLAFLGKYREFHLNYRDHRFKEAAIILMDLATSGCAPPFFLPVLLTDALPLMGQDATVFTATEIYRLLATLEELKASAQRLATRDFKDAIYSLGDNEQLIRATFAETLASVELHEISA